jgi:hypothetical protein
MRQSVFVFSVLIESYIIHLKDGSMDKEIKTICLHQFIRPTRKRIGPTTCGECTECISNDDNKYCECYYPILVLMDNV